MKILVIAVTKPYTVLSFRQSYFTQAEVSLRKVASTKGLNIKNVMHVYVILNPEVLHFLCWH